MGYFANSTEGDTYEHEFCRRCVNRGTEVDGCWIWEQHLVHNYDECNNKDSFLHILIPREKGRNQRCVMFRIDPEKTGLYDVDLFADQ